MSQWAGRPSRHARGYGAEWTRTRARILKRDGWLCIPCLKQGRVASATSVDHIKPKAQGGTDDDENLQSICAICHKAKTIRDKGHVHRPRVQIGEDGWPIG